MSILSNDIAVVVGEIINGQAMVDGKPINKSRLIPSGQEYVQISHKFDADAARREAMIIAKRKARAKGYGAQYVFIEKQDTAVNCYMAHFFIGDE